MNTVPSFCRSEMFLAKFCKVHIFWEGHKILRNLHLTFDYSSYSQKLGEDFAKFCGLLRMYELYQHCLEYLLVYVLFKVLNSPFLTCLWSSLILEINQMNEKSFVLQVLSIVNFPLNNWLFSNYRLQYPICDFHRAY